MKLHYKLLFINKIKIDIFLNIRSTAQNTNAKEKDPTSRKMFLNTEDNIQIKTIEPKPNISVTSININGLTYLLK